MLLSTLQNKFLEKFFNLTQEFYLTGGTALSAFYLHHRNSVDLDLFTHEDLSFSKADILVNEVCAHFEIPCRSVEITSFFKHFSVGPKEDPLTLHFSKDYSAHLKPPNRFGEIRVDSLDDITANKICATLGRTEIKDLVDLYFLDKAGYSISAYFDLARQKDGGLSFETLAYTLNQFKIKKIPPFMISPLTVDDLRHYLEETIQWLITKAAPPSL